MTIGPTPTYDAIVVGVGAMGSAAVDHLARRGKKVLGIEQFHIAHTLGSSHGGSRLVRQAYLEGADYVPLLRRAYELWDGLNDWQREHGGKEIFTRTGGLYIGPEGSSAFSGSLEAAQIHDLPHRILDTEEIREQFPQFSPSPEDRAIFEENAGWVIPEDTIRVQTARAREHGAEIVETTKALNIEPQADGSVRVHTSSGEFHAAQVIITAGAWATKLLAELHIPMEVRRQLMYWFRPTGHHEEFAKSPVYMHETEPDELFYGFPTIDGGTKAAFHRKTRSADPDHLDREVSGTEIQTMQDRLTQTLPELAADEMLDAQACMYTTTADENFVIGRDPRPGHESVVIACGCSGHAFKFIPVIGELLADMVEHNTTDCGIPMFDPLRFAEVRNAVKLYTANGVSTAIRHSPSSSISW